MFYGGPSVMGNLREGHVGKGSYDRGPIFSLGHLREEHLRGAIFWF